MFRDSHHHLLPPAIILLLGSIVPFSDGAASAHRVRRYLVFPEGSTFSWAFCMTIKAITPDVDIFSEAVAVAVSYDLPHVPTALRQTRDLRLSLASLLDRLDLPGEACVRRAACEFELHKPELGLLYTLLRLILGYTITEEDQEKREEASEERELCCDPTCPISFAQLFSDLSPLQKQN